MWYLKTLMKLCREAGRTSAFLRLLFCSSRSSLDW
uniref:Uncharacterized protein n=1 Tax=Anopheles albimanus TaxID=7167 RepID=A0A182FWV8_ANOAL